MLEEKREIIINVHFIILQIAAKNQHVYTRWRNVLMCMIEKDLGSANIYQLRVIHLYECDSNLLLGLYMREMDQHCEDNHLFNKGSYGERPRRQSIDPVIMDVTQVEVAMITRRLLVWLNNDATACFDRIMPHILCLCLRSCQMPAEFTGLLGDLLRYANYAITPADGVSKETYSHSTESPVFGSGQGSTVSATGWGKLVSIALDMHDKQRFSSKYSDTEGTFKRIIDMLNFVDDNNISNTEEIYESIEDVIKQTQHDAQL